MDNQPEVCGVEHAAPDFIRHGSSGGIEILYGKPPRSGLVSHRTMISGFTYQHTKGLESESTTVRIGLCLVSGQEIIVYDGPVTSKVQKFVFSLTVFLAE